MLSEIIYDIITNLVTDCMKELYNNHISNLNSLNLSNK